MLKANRSNIKNSNIKNEKEKRNETTIDDKYLNLSSKTKLLIKSELKKTNNKVNNLIS